MEKSPELVTDEYVCKDRKQGSLEALNKFRNNLPENALKVGKGAAASVVCKKAFLTRFWQVLLDACITITGCS